MIAAAGSRCEARDFGVHDRHSSRDRQPINELIGVKVPAEPRALVSSELTKEATAAKQDATSAEATPTRRTIRKGRITIAGRGEWEL
ncbi:MAG: hypothetical protein CL931_07315 [Deltaproteobacteria bacterium]|nr:hypothetical protein [Deltaproteobacteria bacterium]